MKPEKSNLIKISLCALSCVFFGCGKTSSKTSSTQGEPTQVPVDSKENNSQDTREMLAKLFAQMGVLNTPENQKMINQIADNIDNGTITANEFTEDFNETMKKLIPNSTCVEECKQSMISLGSKRDDKEFDDLIKKAERVYAELGQNKENLFNWIILEGKGKLHRSCASAIVYGLEMACNNVTKNSDAFLSAYEKFKGKLSEDVKKSDKFIKLEQVKNQIEKFKNDFVGAKDGGISLAFRQLCTKMECGLKDEEISKFVEILSHLKTLGEKKEVISLLWEHFIIGTRDNRKFLSNPWSDRFGKAAEATKEYSDFYDWGENVITSRVNTLLDWFVAKNGDFVNQKENLEKYLSSEDRGLSDKRALKTAKTVAKYPLPFYLLNTINEETTQNIISFKSVEITGSQSQNVKLVVPKLLNQDKDLVNSISEEQCKVLLVVTSMYLYYADCLIQANKSLKDIKINPQHTFSAYVESVKDINIGCAKRELKRRLDSEEAFKQTIRTSMEEIPAV